jgi:xylulose-5-phosphate/fructose-6-phosphate phosphoketolase
MIYITGPGHGGPALVANTYLEGTYSEVYPRSRQDARACAAVPQFSFPGGIPSHVAPETPGSIHEGGELGYALSHAYGAAFDNPDLIVACVIGDGEAETGPLAASWHSNKFLNPATTARCCRSCTSTATRSPTRPCSRASRRRAESLLRGLRLRAVLRRGRRPGAMHQRMAARSTRCARRDPRDPARGARAGGARARPALADDRAAHAQGLDRAEGGRRQAGRGHWRSHQVPLRRRAREPRAHLRCSRSGCAATGPRSCSTRTARRARAARSGPRASGAWAPTRTPTAACCCKTCAARLPRLRVDVPRPGACEARRPACSAASCAT